MKKTLIALALATLPVAAMADVTLFGTLKGGLDFTKHKNKETTTTQFDDWGSSLGFKGSEDLGSGLKAIWQLKQNVNFAGPIDTKWASSESFLGLESPAGTLRVGNVGDNIKTNMGDVNPWQGDGIQQLGIISSGIRTTAVRYDTPDLYGFNGNILYSPTDNNGGNSTTYALGLNYNNSGFYAKYGFEYFKTTGKSKAGQVHDLETGYDANNFFLGVGVQFNKDYPVDGDSSLYPNKYIQAAVTTSYTVGNITPRLSYAHGFKKDNLGGYDQVILGADYSLSKRTTALLAVAWKKGQSSEDQTYSAGVGLEHKF